MKTIPESFWPLLTSNITLAVITKIFEELAGVIAKVRISVPSVFSGIVLSGYILVVPPTVVPSAAFFISTKTPPPAAANTGTEPAP